MTQEEVYPSNSFWLWRTFGGEETGGQQKPKIVGKEKLYEYEFGVSQLWDEAIQIIFKSLQDNATELADQFSFLLDFLATWAGVGAKIQNGFGLFSLSTVNHDEIKHGKLDIQKIAQQHPADSNEVDSRALDIRRFFSIEFTLANFFEFASSLKTIGQSLTSPYNPCAFDLRYKYRASSPTGLRERLKSRFGGHMANDLLGNSHAKKESQRWASKIFVGHPFEDKPGQWRLRVYGYVPSTPKPDEIIDALIDFYIGGNGVFPGSSIYAQFKFEEN
jgi:hypothetical protein